MLLNKEVELLLVEDNPDDEELTLLTLREYNLTNNIHVVRDGKEAIDFLNRHGSYKDRAIDEIPSLILLDIKLPKLNGIEVLEIIKNDPKLRKIPVVMLTSSRETLDIERCYDLGVNSYIVKPVNFVHFQNAIRQLGVYWILLNERQDF